MATVREREWTHNGATKRGWEVRYLDPSTGKRPSKTFKLKKDADAFRRKVEREIEDGVHVAPKDSATVEAVCDLFMRDVEMRWRDGRIGQGRFRNLHVAINRHTIPFIGQHKFNEITWQIVDDWYRKLRENGLSSGTARQQLFTLGMLEDFAINLGVTKQKIINDYRKSLKGGSAVKIRTFEIGDVAKLLEALKERPTRHREKTHAMLNCVVNLALFCGLRYGEIMGLTVENVDLNNGTLKIRHSLTKWDDLKPPKTKAGIRDVPMPDHLRELMRAWMATWVSEEERGLVFRSVTGGPITGPKFHLTHWRPLLKRAGLGDDESDRLHFHALRHFAASVLVANNLPLPDVAAMLGHSKFDMTLRVYAHPLTGIEQRRTAVQGIADSLV
ncbi:site-specific integrase [Azospirillum sp. A26]|uniref:site-specific integrase n=1 Tax=Azospirillum sp. A26 TaxID=3160607 RepID=UPI00366EE0D1